MIGSSSGLPHRNRTSFICDDDDDDKDDDDEDKPKQQ
jgi:hypothetical protein